MPRYTNPEVLRRLRIARYLTRCMKALDIQTEDIRDNMDLSSRWSANLDQVTPQLRVLHSLAQYIEKYSKRKFKEKKTSHLPSLE